MIQNWERLLANAIDKKFTYDDTIDYCALNASIAVLNSNKSTSKDTQRKHSTTCPRCGALCSPYQERCDYCDGYFEF